MRDPFRQLYRLESPSLDRDSFILRSRYARQGNCSWQTSLDDFSLAMDGKTSHRACLTKEIVQRLLVAQIIAQAIQRIQRRQQEEVVECRRRTDVQKSRLVADRAIASVDALNSSRWRRFGNSDERRRRESQEDDEANIAAVTRACVG